MLEGCTPWPTVLAERYRAAGVWQGEPLSILARPPTPGHRTQGWATRVAVVAGARRVTYAELDTRADRLAAGLHGIGFRTGDRVVVQLPNGVELVELLLALFRLGAIPVLALAAHRRSEIVYLARSSGAVGYVVPGAATGTAGDFTYRELAAQVQAELPELRHVLVAGAPGPFRALDGVDADPLPLPAPDPGEVAFFLLSGGTTGMPKLIPRTHDDYLVQLRATAAAMGFTGAGSYLAVLPAAHNAALGCPGVLGALLAGGKVVMAGSPSPDEVFPLISREGVTLTTLTPSLLSLWVDLAEAYPADLSAVVIEVGGARLEPDLARRVRPALGATLTHWFGMAEGPLCCTRPDDPPELAATTQGRMLCPDDELRIVDEDDQEVPAGQVGRLLYRGPTTLHGYFRAEEDNRRAFTADGFLRTGDLARLTPDGELVIAGRTKDVINRGGEKVSADELETHLLRHPRTRQVAVVPVADTRLGEKTCAVIVPDGPPPTLPELKDFLHHAGLAEFKLPDRLEIVDSLPTTPLGKVDRRGLAALVDGRQARA